MAGKKYYLRDEGESAAYTPSQVKRLGKAKQLEIMEAWFRTYYEDPAEETPYESKEGGYQYIWGGPYDADEELQAEFSGIISLDRIQELSEELGAENWEWAPTHNHPSRVDDERERDEEDRPPPKEPSLEEVIARLEAGATPQYGGGYEEGLRKNVLDRLEALEKTIHEMAARPAGIGHNNPPPDEDDKPSLSAEGQADLLNATEEIKAELAAPKPDALKVGRAAKVLKKVGLWLAEKADRAVNKVIDVIVPVAMVWASGLGPHMISLLHSAVTLLTHWLDAVSWPF